MRALVLAATATAGFVTAALAVRMAVPRPQERLAAHLEELESSRFTTVFLGTSCFYRAIVPAAFDLTLQRAGIPSRSFNLSAPNMTWGEAAHLIDRIVRGGIQYLMIDGDLVASDDEGVASRKFVDWHDAVATRASMHALPKRSLRLLVQDVRAFFYRALSVGAISDQLVGGRDGLVPLGGDRGFVASERQPNASRAGRHERFAADPSPYLREVEQLSKSERDRPHEWSLPRSEMAQWIIRRARAAGVTVIMVYTPSVFEEIVVASEAPVFDFRQPQRYSELYDLAVRYDPNHLNQRGAYLFSHRLAERFIEWRNALR